MSAIAVATMSDCDTFAHEFRTRWAAPTADRLCELLHEDVRLVQPASPPVVGRENARRMFTGLFNWLPDMRGEVDQWRGADNLLYIEFRLMATIGGQHVEWPAVDRFTLRDNLAAERVSFFDPSALMGAILQHPSTWPGYLRTRKTAAR